MEIASGFPQLLEAGAMGLKKDGVFTTEFTPQDLDGLIRSMLAQSEADMKKQGVSASINSLRVGIENGKGSVATNISATKKVGFIPVTVNITAAFGLENEPGRNGASGRLKTTKLEVAPESLFGIVKPIDFLAPYVEGNKINRTFKDVMGAEMDKRGAVISNLNLEFTTENKLKITANGSAK